MKRLLATTAIAGLMAVPVLADSQNATDATKAAPTHELAVYDLNEDGVIDEADLKLADTNADGVVDAQDEPQQAASATEMAPKAEDKAGSDTAAADQSQTPKAEGTADTDTASADDSQQPKADAGAGTDTAAADQSQAPKTEGTDQAGSTDMAAGSGTDTAVVPGTGAATDSGSTDMAATDNTAANAPADTQPKVSDLGADITGKRVYDAEDKWIGEISEVVVSDDKSKTFAIIDVGGFLGIGEKPVAMDVTDLNIQKDAESGDVRISVNMTKDQIEAMPTYEKS